MLQGFMPLQDENSQPYVSKGRQDSEKRTGGLGRTPAGKTPFGKQLGLASTRKALGNITNRPSGLQQEAVFPKSASKSGLSQRKTLGDITNTTPAKAVIAAKSLPQKVVQQKTSTAQRSQASLQSRAEQYAQDGIERLAGKSKQQLDVDREARDLAEVRSKAAYIASLPAFRPPVLQWSKGMQDLANLEMEVPEAPPSPRDETPSIDDLLCSDSPSSILPEISIGDLGAIADLYSDEEDESQDHEHD